MLVGNTGAEEGGESNGDRKANSSSSNWLSFWPGKGKPVKAKK